MKFLYLGVIIIVFMLGWGIGGAFQNMGAEMPSPITGMIAMGGFSNDKLSPSDIIPEEKIHVYRDKIIIEVDDPEWAKFADTKSMDPVFDKGANALQIVPKSHDQIKTGDIISFTTDYQSGVVIHRVIEIGTDEEGWYAITKGDNNPYKDPGKVRFKDIKKLLFGIIY
jgi:hypothetical protein